MKLTESQKQQLSDSATRTIELARIMEFEQLEKFPKFFPNSAMKNHARRIKESTQALQRDAGYIVKTKDESYVQDHTYALWRIFDKLMRLPEKQLFEFAEGLDKIEVESEKNLLENVA